MFHGEIVKSMQVTDFVLTETTYPSHAVIPRHSHADAYFCFVVQGNFTEKYENKNRICRPAMSIFHPSGETHADRFGAEPGKCFNFQMNKVWLTRVGQSSVDFEVPHDFRDSDSFRIFYRLYREFCNFDEVSPLAVEGLALELVVHAARGVKNRVSAGSPRWLRSVHDLLHDRFTEQLSLKSISSIAGVHPVHLARAFRRQYGCSIGEYVRKLRIDHSCRALSSSNFPISSIAYDAGFSSQSHFSTLFKRYLGTTPAEYRAAFRKC